MPTARPVGVGHDPRGGEIGKTYLSGPRAQLSEASTDSLDIALRAVRGL